MERDKLFEKFNKEFNKFYIDDDDITIVDDYEVDNPNESDANKKFNAIQNYIVKTLNGCLLMSTFLKKQIQKLFIAKKDFLIDLLDKEIASINASKDMFDKNDIPNLSESSLSDYIDECIARKHMIPFYESNISSLNELKNLGENINNDELTLEIFIDNLAPTLKSVFNSLQKGKNTQKKIYLFCKQ